METNKQPDAGELLRLGYLSEPINYEFSPDWSNVPEPTTKRNINMKYALCKKGSIEHIFVSDAETLEQFILDVEQYFDYCPSGYYPYELTIIKNQRYDMIFTEIIVTHHRPSGNNFTQEYFIHTIPSFEKQEGNSMQWDTKKSYRIKTK